MGILGVVEVETTFAMRDDLEGEAVAAGMMLAAGARRPFAQHDHPRGESRHRLDIVRLRNRGKALQGQN